MTIEKSPHLRLFGAVGLYACSQGWAGEEIANSRWLVEQKKRLDRGESISWSGMGNVCRHVVEREIFLEDIPRAALWWACRPRSLAPELCKMGLRAIAGGWGDFVVAPDLDDNVGGPVDPLPTYNWRRAKSARVWTANTSLLAYCSSTRRRGARSVYRTRQPFARYWESAYHSSFRDFKRFQNIKGGIFEALDIISSDLQLPDSLSRTLYEFWESEPSSDTDETLRVIEDWSRECGRQLQATVCSILRDGAPKELVCDWRDCGARGEDVPGSLFKIRCWLHRNSVSAEEFTATGSPYVVGAGGGIVQTAEPVGSNTLTFLPATIAPNASVALPLPPSGTGSPYGPPYPSEDE